MTENLSFRTIMMYGSLVSGIGLLSRFLLEIFIIGYNPLCLILIIGSIGGFITFISFWKSLKTSVEIDEKFKQLDEERRKRSRKSI